MEVRKIKNPYSNSVLAGQKNWKEALYTIKLEKKREDIAQLVTEQLIYPSR